MMIAPNTPSDKHENENGSVLELAQKLEQYARQAAAEGESLHEVEQKVLGTVLEMGKQSVELFIHLQGDGDLGPSVTTEAGQELTRSEQPAPRTIRTVFGTHTFSQYGYAPGPKKKIALRPIDARMSLPEGEYSYLLEEFSTYFTIEQAFGKAQQAIDKVLGQTIPVDSLERISRRMAPQAEEFLENLPVPPTQEEGELLVLTADGKGVPMLRRDLEYQPAFCGSERRGNRQMATLACVYSVDSFVRTPEDIVAALFREERTTESVDRPRPCHKRMVARFARTYEDGDGTLVVSGAYEALAWAAGEVHNRRGEDQVVVQICDGQESLWTTTEACLELKAHQRVEILDIIHVSQYVWSAAQAFCGSNSEQAEAFAQERLRRILQGGTPGVVRGWRRMATERGLTGQKLKDVQKACNYLENNAHRMRYDEYLAAGYPIASGVIEGACRHLVKDRMERSGMRWSQAGAEPLLTLRAVHVSEQWDAFQQQRITADCERLHPHRHLLDSYTPYTLAI